MNLLAAEFDIVIPDASVNYWPWVGGIVGFAFVAVTAWIVTRAVRRSSRSHDHAWQTWS